MANYYGCCKETILKYAKSINYINKKQGKLTDEQKKEIVGEYKNATSVELAERYNVSRGQITKVWYDNNLIGKDRHYYPLNYNYFENIDSSDKAYFLGFLAADGNVTHRNYGNAQSIMRLSLKSEDKYILDIFNFYLNSEKPLYKSKRQNSNYTSYIYTLEIVSDKIAHDLEKYNIVPYKTYKYEMVELKNEFMPHYFRGYFDGDGSISIRNNKIHSPSQYSINICGFIHNLEKMKKYLETQNIKSTIIIENRPSKNNKYDLPFGNLVFCNINEKYKFLKYIYQNKQDIYLHRKEYKANCFFNAIERNYSNRQKIYTNITNAVLNETNK